MRTLAVLQERFVKIGRHAPALTAVQSGDLETVDTENLLREIGDAAGRITDDRELPAVPAYPAELNQVWTNLIDNAADAMHGAGTLTVRTARDGEFALVEIGDTGTGAPPDVTRRIFEPFFTAKSVGQGTGLGLDVSWRVVVNRHHGDLTLQSQPGDTRFQVRLPLQDHP